MREGRRERVPLAKLKPYWRNPRDSRESIEKIKASIREYGYNQTIAVDPEFVIIAGHGRYRALLELKDELGIDEVAVEVLAHLSPQEAKAYRIIDNKSAEFATWTTDLGLELREISNLESMRVFFGRELDDLLAVDPIKPPTQEEIDATKEELAERHRLPAEAREVVCPSCGNSFEVL